MPKILKKENVNSSFFNGYYKEIWRQIFPEKTTLAETDFIIAEGKLVADSHVLDIMCGHGRHTIELARRGINVTAVDNLQEYTNEINEKAKLENLNVESICIDLLELQINKKFDAVICMGNSLQFFDEEDTLSVLSNIAEHIKPGGKFFINTWSLAEMVMKNFKNKTWSKINNLLFLTESKFLLRPARIETSSIIITEKGEREEKSGVDYVFSVAELEAMLNKSGFILNEIYSIPGKKQFSFGEPRAYLVAERK